MKPYRNALPQEDGELFLTDGGLETTLIFHNGIILPDFAAFVVLDRPGGREVLEDYYRGYARIAERVGAGLILESPTWRASRDWGARLGYDRWALAEVNRRAIEQLDGLRREWSAGGMRVVVSGCVGPRGDGYEPTSVMSAEEAEAYHLEQVETFAAGGADMAAAITMNYVEEAIGVARAARRAGLPVAISFTVETDGTLPTGQTLKSAIAEVDAATSAYPAYYMINCAHPTHFADALEDGAGWVGRIRGIRANASCRSHAELNEAVDLDIGDPVELGSHHARLKARFPHLNVFGGCCGTDLRHVERIAEACSPRFAGVS